MGGPARCATVSEYTWARWVMEHFLVLAMIVAILFVILALLYWFQEIRGLITGLFYLSNG
jgi:hypothetical protein